MSGFRYIGKDTPRPEGGDKAGGKAYYVHDLERPGMLFGKIKFSDHAHARIVHIDTTKAERLPGVRAVLTGYNTPEIRIGFLKDNFALKRDKVRQFRDEVAAVAAIDPDVAAEAVDLIEVEYAKNLCRRLGVEWHYVPMDALAYIGGSMVDVRVPFEDAVLHNDLPSHFMPGRNLMFVMYAASWGFANGINDVVVGVSQVPLPGLPDCRRSAMTALEVLLDIGIEADILIQTPLIDLTKPEIWDLAWSFGPEAVDSGGRPTSSGTIRVYTCQTRLNPPSLGRVARNERGGVIARVRVDPLPENSLEARFRPSPGRVKKDM